MKKSFWTCYIAIWVSIYRFSRTPSWLARSNCVYHAHITQPLWNNIITSQFEPLEQKYWYVTLCLWDQGIHWCYLNFIYHATSHTLHNNISSPIYNIYEIKSILNLYSHSAQCTPRLEIWRTEAYKVSCLFTILKSPMWYLLSNLSKLACKNSAS